MQIPYFGGCPCGAARYRCDSEPVAMYNCHCPGCQKLHGAPWVPLLVLPPGATQISGQTRPLGLPVPNDKHAQRIACACCGFPLLARSDTVPGICVLNAASLDDASWFSPVADIWTAYARPWACMDRHIPKVHKSPPALGGEVV